MTSDDTDRSWVQSWPDRDLPHPGATWPHEPVPVRADIQRYEHRCPDGTVLVAASQWVPTAGVTLDRWTVGGHLVAMSSRNEPNTIPPDFTWADTAAA